jgi:hypothetical protein
MVQRQLGVRQLFKRGRASDSFDGARIGIAGGV